MPKKGIHACCYERRLTHSSKTIPMKNKKVFIFGSKGISELTPQFYSKLDEYISENCSFLVGDCAGVDRAVQVYLQSVDYRNVFVYASFNPVEELCRQVRNNVGAWDVTYVETDKKPGTYEFRRAKDIAMIRDCDESICLWNGKSKGSRQNMQELGELGKTCQMFP